MKKLTLKKFSELFKIGCRGFYVIHNNRFRQININRCLNLDTMKAISNGQIYYNAKVW